MMGKRIVVALGGNAILDGDPSYAAQKTAVDQTAKALAQLVKQGHQLIVTHGNGPQVGNLLLQQLAADSKKNPALPIDTLGAMTQGSIGYWLQNSLQTALSDSNVQVAAIVTQTIVDEADSAFKSPSKPVGPFYTAEEAQTLMAQNPKLTYKEDAGRGWRRVVPSPLPIAIAEIPIIKQLVAAGTIVIAGGGGGIPVARRQKKLVGLEGVIDKDFTAEKLAEQVEADELLILTAVDHVYTGFGTPEQRQLTQVTAANVTDLIKSHEFAAGSMLPKMIAAKNFVTSRPNGRTVITSLDNLKYYGTGDMGTIIER
ncbi:carbamate kinase [Levilactobacillus suantsaiihabitans]|uniref:Carbamate kinase n=1 Tax=Levilactobacillus suantsaiihabitans TaxID=2487722 RepID=A0A4Z0J9A6_9LACO|nr:carbamate kinase [Levilactobacillus suantsaiihabitans]TGD18322.1 carbamate kinase [Levilactobacillus suantsaiihabitans]